MADLTGETVLVLGGDGYTGFPLSQHLARLGAEVVAADNLFRRTTADSVTRIAPPETRVQAVNEAVGGPGSFYLIPADATDYTGLYELLRFVRPDAVVNLAQIPSAPYSMRSPEAAWYVHDNNVRGSLNLLWALRELGARDTPVVQLATMGEYGTPDEQIPEGFLPDGRPAPKDPGSFYHASKVAATVNTYFAAKAWGIPVTEVYQGIVYGLYPYPRPFDGREVEDGALLTRFDVDEAFGTVINRFTAQAVAGVPLTVYGEGGQTRAVLPLAECVECLTRVLVNPPDPDEDDHYPYRAVNQFGSYYSVRELAETVLEETGNPDLGIETVPNPRAEEDREHRYDPERETLDRLGYSPSRTVEEEVRYTARILRRNRDRLPADFAPRTTWGHQEP